ncbi:MAG TPA: Nif11-like leader peptide family RiPP precursor [Dongiaceae bacterium]|jgi:predicted ribosomally synthesized peptide with nif11-like leader|nr:Nif11-like leader peptide family RiPP precursor [Dongiaceae bacterium]
MSKSEMTRFVAAVNADAGLKALAKAKGTDVPGVIQLAHSKGYDIGEADVEEYVQSRRAELTEEDLGAVAGGAAPSRVPAVIHIVVIF